jgi:uncharacterized protein
MTSMRTTILLSAAALLFSALPASAQQVVRIGTSGSGSVFYTLGVGASRLVQEYTGANVSVESVGGSHANVFALMSDQVDLAIINAQAAFDGRAGNKPFPQKIDMCLIAQGQLTLRQVLVRKASNITTAADLAGKTWITSMPANPDIAKISYALMKVAGISLGTIKSVSMAESREAITGLETGTIDAVTFPASAGAPNVAQLMDAGTIDILRLPPELVEKMDAELPPGVANYTLPAGTYPNQDTPAAVFGMRTYIVAQCGLPEDQGYKLTSAILDHTAEFAQYHPTGADWNIDNTVDKPVIPFHAGAVKYLKEKGVWTDALDKKQGAQ